jgi:hypothetical protein
MLFVPIVLGTGSASWDIILCVSMVQQLTDMLFVPIVLRTTGVLAGTQHTLCPYGTAWGQAPLFIAHGAPGLHRG